MKVSLLIISCLVNSLLFAQTSKEAGMAGKLVAVHDHSISVRNDQVTQTFQINAETKIWRGHDVDLHHLHLGKDIAIQCRPSSNDNALAIEIWANTDRWWGTITKVLRDRVQIARRDDHNDPDGTAIIIFDGTTIFNKGSRQDLETGRFLEVIGFVLRKRQMQAHMVLHIEKQ